MIGLFATISLLVWLYMFAGHGQFWSTRETDDEPVDVPESWPMVVAIVPARDEATVIGRSIASLLMQDYPGEFRIILVDDGSSDGTASIAETAAAAAGSSRLRIVSGAPLTRTSSMRPIRCGCWWHARLPTSWCSIHRWRCCAATAWPSGL
jgi:cellulose synthase/poly-beta-1,6-N-acetylglucosamine synthase-like glycosyltransferase